MERETVLKKLSQIANSIEETALDQDEGFEGHQRSEKQWKKKSCL